MLVGFAVFWAITGKESALLVGASTTLIGLGSAGGAIVTVRRDVTERAERHKEELRKVQQQGSEEP